MIKRIIPVVLLVLCASLTIAQETSKYSKFGKIDPKEFETKVSGTDSASSGIKLFDIGKCYFQISPATGDFEYIYERHVRYKVLTKSGYDLADFEIGLYRADASSLEVMEGLEAVTYNLENGKIVPNKLLKDAKFTENHDKNWTIKKFTLPNVKEGSILEYKYRIKSPFLYTLRDWYFQAAIPTLYSEYSVRIPEYFRYKISPKGFFPIQQLKMDDVNESFYVKSERNTTQTVQARSLAFKYVAEKVPAIKAEPYITTLEDYIAKVDFEISSIQYPGGLLTDYNSTWPKIIIKLMEDENFGRFFKKDNYSKTLVTTLVKEETAPEAKVKLLYNYVKNNLKWNGNFNKYSSTTQVKHIFDKKSGNSADINLSLLSLLTAANINASPVLVSTRDNGQHPGHPVLTKFNNVILSVEIDSNKFLLDATDKHLSENLISFENLNYEGLKIDAKATTGAWISLETAIPSRNNAAYNLKLHEDNTLTGTMNLSFSQYDAMNQRIKFSSASNEAAFLRSFTSDKPGLEIKTFTMDNLNNPAENFTESMTVAIEDYVEDAGNLVMLSPLFFSQTKNNPFSLEEREYPVDFAHPMEETIRVVIEFPANYKLEKLPANGKLKLPNNEASFSYSFITEGNKVSITSKISVAKPFFSPDEYPHLRELFRIIVEKQAQQIVFKKS